MAGKQMFDMDDRDLRKLRRLYKRAPRQMRAATAGVLNSFAFGVREEIPKSIDALMTVRNPRFVKSKTRVEMAKRSQPISNQTSRVGSLLGPRFTGWKEQQLGTRSTRSRVATLNARGGNFSKPMQGKARLKPNQKFLDPDSIKKVKDDNHRLFVFFKIHERRRKQQAFTIRRKTGRFKPGLYRFKGKKIRKQQDFQPRRVQPHKKPWMQHATRKYFQGVSIPRIWQKEVRRVFKLK
jgi:hypothetical protein